MQAEKRTVQLIRKAMERYGSVELTSEGNSMFPLIREGDRCRFVSCGQDTLKRGDIALFISREGRMIAHRFHRYVQEEGKQLCLFKGDTNMGFDDPVSPDQVIGRLDSVKKRRFRLMGAGLIYRVWARLILTLPSVSGILRLYLNKRAYETNL